MQYWNDIIHTAMLGTGKKQPDSTTMPTTLQQAVAKLSASDLEERFLQTVALAYNFRQCSVAATAAPASATPAEPEILNYCSTQSMALLSDILNAESTSLLQLWLQACQQKGQVVQPDAVPELLEIAVKQKSLRTLIADSCGNRGRWLGQFNPAWKFGSTDTPEEIWQTGTLQQRVQVLTDIRKQEPAKALEWLQATWPQETAATKEELLTVLENSISAADLSFLESLSGEKSKKVKEAALALVKLIPESAIMQAYWQVLKEAIYLKKEKALLGLSNKTKLVVQLPENVAESIYQSGIDKLSANAKELSDEQYILQQLASQVPPQWWEGHLGESKETIVQLLQKSNTAFLLPAMGRAAIRFKDADWAQVIIKASDYSDAYAAAMPLLPIQEQEMYAMEMLAQEGNIPHAIIPRLLSFTHEWSLLLARKILPVMMNDPWRFNEAFFNQNIHLLPVAILPELTTWKPKAEWHQNYWSNTIMHIDRLLQLKQAIA